MCVSKRVANVITKVSNNKIFAGLRYGLHLATKLGLLMSGSVCKNNKGLALILVGGGTAEGEDSGATSPGGHGPLAGSQGGGTGGSSLGGVAANETISRWLRKDNRYFPRSMRTILPQLMGRKAG